MNLAYLHFSVYYNNSRKPCKGGAMSGPGLYALRTYSGTIVFTNNPLTNRYIGWSGIRTRVWSKSDNNSSSY